MKLIMQEIREEVIPFLVFGIIIPSIVTSSAAYLNGWHTGEKAISGSEARFMGFFRGTVLGGALGALIGAALMIFFLKSENAANFAVSGTISALVGAISGSITGSIGADDGHFFASMHIRNESKEVSA